MADPEKPRSIPEATPPSAPQTPENSTDNAILRNLAALMGREERRAFNAQQNPLQNTGDDAVTDEETPPASPTRTQHPAPTPDSATDAAEMRRQKRIASKGSLDTDANPGEQEFDVIFDEDSNQSPATISKIDSPSPQKRFLLNLSPVEFTAITLIFIVGVVTAVMLTGAINAALREFNQTREPAHRVPSESLAGELLQLSGIECYWRDRNANDRVQETSNILPLVTIKSATGPGSLQILFHDELGKLRGDTHIFRIKTEGSNPPVANSPITALGTEGLLNEIQFTAYQLEDGSVRNEYWTVTFKESSDEEHWILIGNFRMPANRL